MRLKWHPFIMRHGSSTQPLAPLGPSHRTPARGVAGAWGIVAISVATACASGVLPDPYGGVWSDASMGTAGTDADGSSDSAPSTGEDGSGTVGADSSGRPDSADSGSAATDTGGTGDDGGSTDVRSNDDGGYADRGMSDSAPSQDAGTSDGAGSDPCAQYSASCTYCTPNRGGSGCGWCNGGCHQGTSGGPASAGVCGATPWVWKSSSCP